MTVARSEIVDVEITPWYHVTSKTVRGANLLDNQDFDRKQWIEERLQLLAQVFAIHVASFTVLSNHLHLMVCLDPDWAREWSDREVIRRWFIIHPPRSGNRKPLEITAKLIGEHAQDKKRVAEIRKRLANLGWFMKSLKEPLARLANQVDETTGAFWQSRYKSVAILDEQSLLATGAYIDLNPLAAGLVDLPEWSQYTSIRRRLEHCLEQGRLDDLYASLQSSVAGAQATRGLEDGHWLCPIADRRQQDPNSRRGLLDGFSLGSYLQLVDWTSRLVREGKANVSPEVADMLTRLGTTTEAWEAVVEQLFSSSRLTGVTFAFSRDRLRAAAKTRKRHHVANFGGCPA